MSPATCANNKHRVCTMHPLFFTFAYSMYDWKYRPARQVIFSRCLIFFFFAMGKKKKDMARLRGRVVSGKDNNLLFVLAHVVTRHPPLLLLLPLQLGRVQRFRAV